MSRTPLAWKNLTSDWRRLFLGAAGVGFAAVLMFMQNGFRNALLDSPVQILKAVDCDLVATSRARFSLTSEYRFSYDLLNQVAADPDVISAIPVYIERARAQIRVVGNKRRPIRVVGIPLRLNRFSIPEIQDQLAALEPPRSALLDRRTRSQYGFAVDDLDQLANQSVELLNNDIRMVGTFGLGTDFANDGTVLLSQDNFAHYFPFRGSGDPLSVVDLGLIHLNPDADPVKVAKRLQSLAPDVWVVTPREDLVQREIQFWNTQTPIGMIFFIGSMMGFAVGVIICYQILFTSIHDSMPEFATLKAMGYPNRYFLGLVVRQSLYLSLIGFLPALLVSWGLFQVLQMTVGLPMLMDPWRIGSVLGLTVLMCLVSGILALRKLITADPASLF